MESATLIRPRPGAGPLARLRAVPDSLWTRAGFILLCIGAAGARPGERGAVHAVRQDDVRDTVFCLRR